MEASGAKQFKVKSSLRLKSKTPLEKDEIHKISTILMHLNNHNDSLDFREPVNWKELELYDYPEVIKYPMDLGTVSAKFKDKKYKTVEQVLNEIQLIWDNCKLYNPKTSDIYELADRLELSFRRMVRNYLPNLKVASVTSAPIRPITEPPFTVVYKPDREDGKPTLLMKKTFVDRISGLNELELEKVINIIRQFSPKSFIESEEEWARIEVETINTVNFNKLLNAMSRLGKASEQGAE